MAARAYTILVGLLLLVVGIMGLAGKVPLHLHHNLFHLASGVVALVVGLGCARHARTFARVFGGLYVVLLLLGLAGVSDLGPIRLSLNATPVLYVHGAVGLAGLLAGFLGKSKPQASAKAAA